MAKDVKPAAAELFPELAHGEAGVVAEDGQGGVTLHRGTLVSRNEHEYLVLKAHGGAHMLYIPVRRVIQVLEPL